MVLYCTYYVRFFLNGETKRQTKRYRAHSPGEAFQKCHRESPDVRLIKCWRQSERNGEHAITYYETPSTISIAAGPGIVWEQIFFGFAISFLSNRKNRAGAGTQPASQLKPSPTQT